MRQALREFFACLAWGLVHAEVTAQLQRRVDLVARRDPNPAAKIEAERIVAAQVAAGLHGFVRMPRWIIAIVRVCDRIVRRL